MESTNSTTLPECNGYSTKFSWLVSLWLDNIIIEWANEAEDKWQLADHIKEFVEEQNPLAEEASLFSDMLGYAIAIADYDEVASAFWADREQSDDD